ncbi:MAG: hypothetical protein AAGJ70_12790 [Pseudomonadota bacterium]
MGLGVLRTIVYADGFNLYYRCLKRRPDLRWLDLRSMASRVLQPRNRIVRVDYYTSRVSGLVHNESPRRQQAYILR